MFAIGNNEAMIYSELISRQMYFEDRGQLTPDGYFFNTVEDLWSGTNLNDYHQRIAIKNLKKIGLIDVQLRGVPARRYFRVHGEVDLLLGLLKKGRDIQKNAGKPTENVSSENFKELDIENLQTNNNKNKPKQFDVGFMTTVGEQFKKNKGAWKYN